jgi:AcrR family transcriptional regulator
MSAPQETLREQQKRMARERIVDAAAAAIVEHGLEELSVPAVAESAGVSLRTVYNYFESKEALIQGIEQVANERLTAMGVIEIERDLTRVGEAIRTNWPMFGALGTLGDAASVVRVSRALARGRSSTGTSNAGFDAAMREALADQLATELDADQQEALFGLLRGIVSSESFYRMRQLGVGPEAAGDVTAWAFEVLNRSLRAGDLPFPPPGS